MMLTRSEQKFLNDYKEQLKPKRKFILAHGIAFGLVMLLLQSADKYFIQKKSFVFQDLLIEMLVSLIAGLCYGWIMHFFLSWKLKKIEQKQSNA